MLENKFKKSVCMLFPVLCFLWKYSQQKADQTKYTLKMKNNI